MLMTVEFTASTFTRFGSPGTVEYNFIKRTSNLNTVGLWSNVTNLDAVGQYSDAKFAG